MTNDAVRMRVRRGKLASIRVNERTFVLWPQPEPLNEPRTARKGSDPHSVVRQDDRLVTALEERIASLEQHLAERTEEIRRRDHIIAGLVERMRELPATVPEPETSAGIPSDATRALQRAGPPEMPYDPYASSGDRLALGWRRWWRRITRHDEKQ
jgi:hypothetical protein